MTEDQLEQQCLQWFAEGGWEVVSGPDLAPDGDAPERADYRQVLLLADLEAAIRRINPHLPQSAVEQAERLGDTANLGRNGFDGCPFGGVVLQVLQNHAHSTFTDFRGVAIGFRHASFSQELRPPRNPV